MSKMTGMNVKVWITDPTNGDAVLAGQRNATLKRQADSIDSTSKDTAGFWKESLAGFKSWGVDCDGAYVESDAAYQTLETAYLNSQDIGIYLQFPSGAKYSGRATIKDFSLELPYDGLVTYKLQFDGNGALSKIATAPTSIAITPSTLSVGVGKTAQIPAATITPTTADPVVTYRSSDNTVATVNADGLVTGVKAGTATITVASVVDPTVKTTVSVTVA